MHGQSSEHVVFRLPLAIFNLQVPLQPS